MKPKIKLVGGCAASFENEAVAKSGNDSKQSVLLNGCEASVLLDEMLQIIIRALNASAGAVSMRSPDGKESRCISSTYLPDVSRTSGGVIEVALGMDEALPNAYLSLYFSEENAATDEIAQAVKPYADLVYIALKNTLLQEHAHQNNLLVERQSIANEIHDSLAQTLYYTKIRANLLLDALKSQNDILAFKCAQDIDEALEGGQKTVRELVTHFRCQMDPKGLKYALEKLAKDFITRTNIALEYENHLEEINLPLEYELQIFLIVREALVNIATHSGADHARLTVTRSYNQYQFTVEDNGGGVGSGIPAEGHYGLEIMRERALRISGMVEVENLENKGTRVQLIFSTPVA